MGIHKIAENSRRIVASIDLLITEAVQGEDKFLVDLNRQQMLNHKLKTEAPIKPDYSPSYAKFKGFNTPNLKLTGDFQNDMYLSTNGKEYSISSNDHKTWKLINKYTRNIFGIPKSKEPKARNKVIKSLRRIYYKKLLNA